MAPPLGLARGPGGSTRHTVRTKNASVGRVGLGFFPSARAVARVFMDRATALTSCGREEI
jgi:hypothetical protein